MADINLTLAVITLNVNGLNTPVKRQRLAARILKKKKKWLNYKINTLDSKTFVDYKYEKKFTPSTESWSGYTNVRFLKAKIATKDNEKHFIIIKESFHSGRHSN